MSDDPQTPIDRQLAVRHLLQHPLTCKELDPDIFRLIRRHETALDRWFTQRLGYRLHVDAETARLFKTGVVPERRPLRTATGRPFHQIEYVLLSLVLAATSAGPAVISLRDLVEQVRTAAAEADIDLADDTTGRRALVAVLQWMITLGLAAELHAHVDTYAHDATADAVLKVRPDRIALLPLPALVGPATTTELLTRAERRSSARQWMRCRLVEDPVLYRDDLTEAEWGELRRRQGEEERILDEMMGLRLEARAEGVAAVDPDGTLAEQRFPAGGTVGHAALLLLEVLRPDDDADARPDTPTPWVEIVDHITALAKQHASHWANDARESPERLARQVVELLVDLRLATRDPTVRPVAAPIHGAEPPSNVDDRPIGVRLLPAAGRFRSSAPANDPPGDLTDEDADQATLW